MCTGKVFLVPNASRTSLKTRGEMLNFLVSPFLFFPDSVCFLYSQYTEESNLFVTHLESDKLYWNFWIVCYSKSNNGKAKTKYYILVYQSYLKL